ncbi:MAG: PDZ domain-containing protein [Actinobacteria bacterium]|nr:PDZ domain-containing protein [Actinomycetota bacterium]
MPDNRSLWSDGPSEDEHHGWLDAEPDAPATKEHRPAPAEEPTRQHRTGRMSRREPREGPSTWQQVRPKLLTPLVALCVVALLASGIAIGTRLIGERTVERTVVAGNSGGATSSQIKAAYTAAHDGVLRVTTSQGNGTGWVYDDRGTIVTNNHVIAGGGDTVKVRFTDDGADVDARVLGTDVSSDLAVLRVDPNDVDKLVPLKVAESDDVETGDPVVAIGYPLGLDQTTTAGIISGVGRQIPAQNNFQIDKVLQTDAPINPGNSGGPLLNIKGEVVGVNSQIATASAGGGSVGIGFAIPSDTVRDVVPTLAKGQTVKHAYLGVSVAPLTKGEGAAVGDVRSGSPAQQAGLRPNSETALRGLSDPDGDVITKIDGTAVNRPDDVTRIINDKEPGDRISIEYRRGSDTRSTEVTLGDRASAGGAAQSPSSPTLTLPGTPTSPSSPTIP